MGVVGATASRLDETSIEEVDDWGEDELDCD